MILGDKITKLRKQNGWSQEELAEKLGISRQNLNYKLKKYSLNEGQPLNSNASNTQ